MDDSINDDLTSSYIKESNKLEHESNILSKEAELLSKRMYNLSQESKLLSQEFRTLVNKYLLLKNKKNLLKDQHNLYKSEVMSDSMYMTGYFDKMRSGLDDSIFRSTNLDSSIIKKMPDKFSVMMINGKKVKLLFSEIENFTFLQLRDLVIKKFMNNHGVKVCDLNKIYFIVDGVQYDGLNDINKDKKVDDVFIGRLKKMCKMHIVQRLINED